MDKTWAIDTKGRAKSVWSHTIPSLCMFYPSSDKLFANTNRNLGRQKREAERMEDIEGVVCLIAWEYIDLFTKLKASKTPSTEISRQMQILHKKNRNENSIQTKISQVLSSKLMQTFSIAS